jgi:23S rRNA (cytidine1920-2'-O)/16S rRNA (cytidine1409-2'-O)-methyltransferase
VAAALLAAQGQVLGLLKPLFEVESPEARRRGQVDDPTLLVSALRSVLDAGSATGLVPIGAAKLALRPRHGVTEFFVFFGSNPNQPPLRYDDTMLMGIVEGLGIGSSEEE